jgi:uncharacterized protein (TIGR03083 family)
MSWAGIAGMTRAGHQLLTAAATFTDDDWRAPSAAAGWSVQDVVAHVGCLLGDLVDAVHDAPLPDTGVEELNDLQVALRRNQTPRETVSFVVDQLGEALAAFEPLQDEPTASTQVQMLDLGCYPLHAIADMFTFDITTHLRYDVLAPRGPIHYELPPLDEVLLGPSVAWLLAGLPKMQTDLVGAITGPVALTLTGPGAQRVLIQADGDALAVTPADHSASSAAATITSTSTDFLAWSTGRLNWRNLVTVDGDHATAYAFLEALNLV